MNNHEPASNASLSERPGLIGIYQRTPLFARILVALVVGVIVGLTIGPKAAQFKPFSSVVLRLLGALATPLIFIAVIRALVKAQIKGKTGLRLVVYLFTNTVIAILVGLTVANLVQPGRRAKVTVVRKDVLQRPFDPVEDLLGKIPGSILKPLAENDIMSVILIALVIGVALKKVRRELVDQDHEHHALDMIEAFLDTGFRLVMVVLHWVLELVPFAVFGVVAQKIGSEGLEAFKPLIWFVVSVIAALLIQAAYYLLRVKLGSWVTPMNFIKGSSNAILTAFSTASSAATLPITFRCMTKNIGVKDESASLGVMVGGAFNHDGTALYEAMAALYISQLLGRSLGFGEQILVVFMAVMASVGAAGIPEAGLVTMLAVFKAVNLPTEFIPMLLVVDWFLDRCRTAINVMGDMSVTCLLDGKSIPPSQRT